MIYLLFSPIQLTEVWTFELITVHVQFGARELIATTRKAKMATFCQGAAAVQEVGAFLGWHAHHHEVLLR